MSDRAAHYAALILTGLLVLPAVPALAQNPAITIHPNSVPNGDENVEINIPPLNNPNYLDPGPAPFVPGASKSEDYMQQAGGDSMGGVGVGIGGDVDADLLPDSDSAYNLPP
ncbi:hypothetical protein MKI84_01875 [Ancylobacter sp. A5.8]|uniref:hypothetical protein n=1 Tax=Ancylobacter gelatini TaxID=2919920 RepID=UPI001F4ECB08|nr:hypothetical protein [Ancylobacter gelatini]MCJ8141657.1 hypothetical protein [Ancylobacter gelatini]